MYLAAVNVASLLFIYSMILILTLSIGFDIDLSSYNVVSCRLSVYVTFLFDSLSSFYLILAAIDRVMVTSVNALTRQRSTPRLARLSLAAGTLFWMLFHMHALILTDVLPIGPSRTLCTPVPGSYSNFIGYYLLLVKSVLVPLLMAIFGLWTMRNIQNVRHRRVAPACSVTGKGSGANWTSINSKDRPLVLILLMNVSLYVVFNLPLSITAMYQQVTPTSAQTFEQVQMNQFIRLVTLFISYVPPCIDFYGNLLVSKSFRSEAKRLITARQ